MPIKPFLIAKDCKRFGLVIVGLTSLGWMLGYPIGALTIALALLLVSTLLQLQQLALEVHQSKAGSKPKPVHHNSWSWLRVKEMDRLINTLRQQSHNQRQSAKNKAHEIRQLYSMLNTISYGLLIVDTNDLLLWSNKTARRLLNLKRSDEGGMLTMFVRTPRFVQFWEQRQYDQPCFFTYNGSTTTVIEAMRLRYVKDKDILLLRNITLQEQQQQTRLRFLGHASHELQSPLTVIRGNAELALDAQKKQKNEHIQQILHQVDHITKLMHSLMLITRLDESHVPEDQSWFHPEKIIQLAAQTASREVDNPSPIVYKLAPQLEIHCNQNDLFIIVRNLVHNALLHAKSTRPIEVVWLRGHWKKHHRKQYALLEVRDFGKGIDPSRLSQLGKRFHLTSTHPKGHGLGLSIVKGITRLYQGRLIMQSALEEGSRFICVFDHKRARMGSDTSSQAHRADSQMTHNALFPPLTSQDSPND